MKNVVAAFLLTIASIGFFIYFKGNGKAQKVLVTSKNCELLSKECTFNYRGQNLFKIHFDPFKVNNKEPFQIIIELLDTDHFKVDQMDIKIQGIDMNLNAFYDVFSKDGKTFQVEAKLPYCTLKKMDWKLLLNFKAKKSGGNDPSDNKQFFMVEDFSVIN